MSFCRKRPIFLFPTAFFACLSENPLVILKRFKSSITLATVKVIDYFLSDPGLPPGSRFQKAPFAHHLAIDMSEQLLRSPGIKEGTYGATQKFRNNLNGGPSLHSPAFPGE